jgi:hypothetical protein
MAILGEGENGLSVAELLWSPKCFLRSDNFTETVNKALLHWAANKGLETASKGKFKTL